jgi:hypothetical protein
VLYTHTRSKRKFFEKHILKFSGKISVFPLPLFSSDEKSANTNTAMNIFNDDYPCAKKENSLALENVLMKKPCVFPHHVAFNPFYGEIFITHICFFT